MTVDVELWRAIVVSIRGFTDEQLKEILGAATYEVIRRENASAKADPRGYRERGYRRPV